MPDSYCFHYEFFPVGQGLFAAGSLHRTLQHQAMLRWVYDCGTISEKQFLNNALDRFAALTAERPYLDLVTLSHFDNDHISGVVQLLGRHRVDMLLLPYMPLWERLAIAFEEATSPDDDLMAFYINPVEYLTGLPEGNIRRIVFVPPSGEEGPPEPAGEPPEGSNTPSDEPLHIDEGKPDDSADAGDLVFAGRRTNTRVAFLRSGGGIRKLGWWEFVPYNDDKPAVFDSKFLQEAAAFRDLLLAGASTAERKKRLQDLKEHYEAVRRPGEERNDISLFLYSGPIYGTWQRTALLCSWDFRLRNWFGYRRGRSYVYDTTRCSILYPGDGFLDTPERLHRLCGYLRAYRVNRIGVMQVMHHGAKRNWHGGVAAAFSPRISVFSSDPKRKPHLHPHKPVRKDFRHYGPIQVNQHRALRVLGRLLHN